MTKIPATLAQWGAVLYDIAESTRSTAKQEYEDDLRQVRHELQVLRHNRQREQDPEQRRVLSRRLWDYEKAFRKQKEDYEDAKAMRRGGRGRYGRKKHSKRRCTMPSH